MSMSVLMTNYASYASYESHVVYTYAPIRYIALDRVEDAIHRVSRKLSAPQMRRRRTNSVT
jgi:hypothetical protein